VRVVFNFNLEENVMSNTTTDVIIHISDEFNEKQYSEIIQHIQNDTGVISACRNAHIPNAISVIYNSSRVHAIKILDQVTSLGNIIRWDRWRALFFDPRRPDLSHFGFLYVPATTFVFAAVTGFCPSLITFRKAMGQ
jgi:hypothetical protein